MSTTATETYRDEYGMDMPDAQYATVNVLSRVAGAMLVDGAAQSHRGSIAGYSEPGNHFVTYEQKGTWVIVRVGERAVPSIVQSDGTVF